MSVDRNVVSLVDAVIEKHSTGSIEDVIQLLPKSMCHVLQEPSVFGTYQPNIVRLMYPEREWCIYDERYREIRDKVIPAITEHSYIENLLLDEPVRLPCFCSQMANVAALIIGRLFGGEVYILRNIYVNYLYLPERWHSINAVPENGRIRYFDASAYAQVINPKNQRITRPEKLEGFDAADVRRDFIVSERWLQEHPYRRELIERGSFLRDTFYPSPLAGTRDDEFFQVIRIEPRQKRNPCSGGKPCVVA
ncbi:hypothetical protein AA12717_2676 [Gluconacetobacter sacchari DSM 12717]|uniref:Transglutaminase-like domain-containing protein n=2 Tax=Gluconacetobacter sacchari TaxID=92759 RepID=A0A7W4IHA5_9PROT|nr:hypothetical protein [Gluconacetobacter sacchari]MBB2162787.1 hypothetical protein [Gluconacetobacter sacchari]GBQ27418.1 hypothetical protein AA12717_2676 [Gluconacetobacter sacchari DSM 12717]